jgi:hypothetical protein
LGLDSRPVQALGQINLRVRLRQPKANKFGRKFLIIDDAAADEPASRVF